MSHKHDINEYCESCAVIAAMRANEKAMGDVLKGAVFSDFLNYDVS